METKLRTDKLNPTIAEVVGAVADAGGSPREQIDVARKATGRAMTYLPHQSTREIERRRRKQMQLAK